MSLTTDAIGLVAAASVFFGSAIQARQAFTELNNVTPLKDSSGALLWAALRTSFKAIRKTDVQTMEPVLRNLGLGKVANIALTPVQVKNLKRWLGWFLGWVYIMIGAFAALVGDGWMLV